MGQNANISLLEREDFNIREISFAKVFDYDVPDTSLFSPFSAYNEDNHFFVFDNASGIIYKFDETGKILKKTGREGRGPNEFITDKVVSLFLCDHRLYAYDWSLPRMQVYSEDLELLNIIQLEGIPYEATCTNDGMLAVLFSSNSRLNVLSPDGNIVKRVTINNVHEEGKFKFKLVEYLPSGLYAKFFKDPVVIKYSDEFTPIDSIYISNYLENSLSSISKNSFTIGNEVHFFTKENNLNNDFEKKYSHVFNGDTGYSYSYELPDSFHNYQIVSHEYLVAFENYSTSLSFYKYKINE